MRVIDRRLPKKERGEGGGCVSPGQNCVVISLLEVFCSFSLEIRSFPLGDLVSSHRV